MKRAAGELYILESQNMHLVVVFITSREELLHLAV
jgi:hypothetical protein